MSYRNQNRVAFALAALTVSSIYCGPVAPSVDKKTATTDSSGLSSSRAAPTAVEVKSRHFANPVVVDKLAGSDQISIRSTKIQASYLLTKEDRASLEAAGEVEITLPDMTPDQKATSDLVVRSTPSEFEKNDASQVTFTLEAKQTDTSVRWMLSVSQNSEASWALDKSRFQTLTLNFSR